MVITRQPTARHRGPLGGLPRWCGAALGLGLVAALMIFGGFAAAAATTVNLGTATPFAVLAGTTVTNTGPSTVFGDVGVSPGSAVVGFSGSPNGTVEPPSTIHAADGVAGGAQGDLTTAYLQAAGEPPTSTSEPADLTGLNLAPGVYQTSSDGALLLTGALTLNAGGNPNAVFVFQTGSSLTTGTSSTVLLTGSASPCNVFWQVGSSATLNGPTFVGTVMALTSITVGSSVTVNGRVLARNGDVTLIDDSINASACTAPVSSATPTPAPASGSGAGGPSTPDTGAVGTSNLWDGVPIVLGGLALLGAGVAVASGRRRRAAAAGRKSSIR